MFVFYSPHIWGDALLFSRAAREERGLKFTNRNAIHKGKSTSDPTHDKTSRKNPKEKG
jgi:hypothetical protein